MGIFLAPGLVRWVPDLGMGLYSFYGEVCHQFGERSLVVGGRPLAVCTRCLAIYYGFLIGATVIFLLPGRVSPPRRLRLVATVALLPMLIDVVAGMVGIWVPTTATRLMTGGWFGFLGSLFLIPIAIDALREILNRGVREIPHGV